MILNVSWTWIWVKKKNFRHFKASALNTLTGSKYSLVLQLNQDAQAGCSTCIEARDVASRRGVTCYSVVNHTPVIFWVMPKIRETILQSCIWIRRRVKTTEVSFSFDFQVSLQSLPIWQSFSTTKGRRLGNISRVSILSNFVFLLYLSVIYKTGISFLK